MTRAPAPPERTVALSGTSETARWPLSQRFDSARALERLTGSNARDRERLSRRPQPPGALLRLLRDPDLRVLCLMVLVAVVGGLAIAAGPL
jgi:hypothetical protein